MTRPERPLIAVTTSEIREHRAARPPDRCDPPRDEMVQGGSPREEMAQGASPREEMALGLTYMRAIEAVGGIPVVVPPLARDALEPLLTQVAGVCLSGGPDLDPVAYRAFRHERIGPTWAELDRFELRLTRAADARCLPILAICRGMQVLNVSRGGTLHQHLPDLVGDRIRHRQAEPAEKPTHWVTISPGSRLQSILGARRKMVNSLHHQAVAELGEGLRITARASDGTVEAIEATDREFTLGVQWHAECLVDQRDHAAVFEAFIDAARRHHERRAPLARAA